VVDVMIDYSFGNKRDGKELVINIPFEATKWAKTFQEIHEEIGPLYVRNGPNNSMFKTSINEGGIERLIKRIPGLYNDMDKSKIRVIKVYSFWYDNLKPDSNSL
jgi:hypothetical protein